jgi:hypothetical protein
MRRILALVLRVASVPLGVGVGLWTAQMPWNCPVFSCPINVPQFATWQCALFGAGAAVTLLALSFADSLTNALRVLSVPVGLSVGLWTAQMTSPLPFSGNCGACHALSASCRPPDSRPGSARRSARQRASSCFSYLSR